MTGMTFYINKKNEEAEKKNPNVLMIFYGEFDHRYSTIYKHKKKGGGGSIYRFKKGWKGTATTL